MPPSENFSVPQIAHLARIEVPDDQLETARLELDKILQFVKMIDALDLDTVEPFFGMDPADFGIEHRPIRRDQVTASTKRDAIFENAPQHDSQYYRVPPVFE